MKKEFEGKKMIPKTIHYCWFGGKEKPKLAQKCIRSWKKYCPDYEIIEWNESNFDVYQNAYTTFLYDNKKYAFLSDYVRLKVIYKYGGIYFDTDVEVIKNIDELLSQKAYFGFETNEYVNTGLGFGAEENSPVIKKMIEEYDSFLDGNHGYIGCPIVNTDALVKCGLKRTGEKQEYDLFTVYPIDYFNPYDDPTGKLNKTENTYSIHWYAKSWMKPSKIIRSKIAKPIHRIFGNDVFSKPYLKAALNLSYLSIRKLLSSGNIIISGIPLLSLNSKLSMEKTSRLRLGDRVISDGRFVIMIGSNAEISIGDHVYFNEGCMLSAKEKIEIKSGCQFGPGVKVFDNNHKFDAEKGVSFEHSTAPIFIGENCWIGANSTILKGTTIGKNCVIGAGCVVKGVIPEGSIVSQTNNMTIKPIEKR